MVCAGPMAGPRGTSKERRCVLRTKRCDVLSGVESVFCMRVWVWDN